MRKMRHILFLALAAIALTACTQDELAEQGAALPEGVYPITIASVQVAEALPQTRWYGEYLERAKPRHGNRKSDGRRK